MFCTVTNKRSIQLTNGQNQILRIRKYNKIILLELHIGSIKYLTIKLKRNEH
jgi:hypothetical protein